MVLVLVGIMIAGVSLSLGDGGREARIKQEAQRLLQLLTLAGEESVLASRESGLLLHQRGYRFVLHDGEQWLPNEDHMFRPRTLPEGMAAELYLDGMLIPLPLEPLSLEGDEPPSPQVLILSSGERSPFELILAWDELPALAFRLEGPMLGPLRLAREGAQW